MKIFKKESSIAGLADKILNNNNSAHTLHIQEVNIPEDAKAALCQDLPQDTDDLFFFQSVLATTNVNLNDDGFSAEEMFLARHTPVSKFVDIEHEIDECSFEFGQAGIVGTMVNSFMLDKDMNELNPMPEEAPDFFHLGTTNVVWRHLNNPKMKARAASIIDDINNNKVAVSMESIFNGFDYGLAKDIDYKSEDGTVDFDKIDIIERNEGTSFLSQYLRAYGGDGIFDERKLFRILKNIIFTGLGIVKNPANPPSVVLKKQKNDKNIKNIIEEPVNTLIAGVDKNEEDISESDKIMSQEQITSLQAEIDSLKKALEVEKEKTAEANLEALRQEIEDLKAMIKTKEASLQEQSSKVEEVEAAKACMCNQFEEKTAELEKVTQEKDELVKQLKEIKDSQVVAQRVTIFTDKGYAEDKSNELVAQLAALDDKAFNLVASNYPDAPVDPDTSNVTIEDVEPAAASKNKKVTPNVSSDDAETVFAKLREGVAKQMKINRLEQETK